MRPIEQGALSASFVVRHRELLREKFGQNAVQAAFAALSPEASKAIGEATKAGWVPVDAVAELFDVVASQQGQDPAELHRELSRRATEHTVRSLWRMLLQFTTDAQLVSQTPVFFRKAWNRGALTTELSKPGVAVMTLSSWPQVPEFTVRGLETAVGTVLTLAGRENVHITHQRTDDGVRYQASWR